MTHICVSKLTIIGSNNGLSPSHYLNQCWYIVYWTLRNEILIKIHTFSFTKMHLKWRLQNGGHFVAASMWWLKLDMNTLKVKPHFQGGICQIMMTPSNGNIFRVTGPLWSVNSSHRGQWRRTLMFSLIWALNKRLSKKPWGWWFDTPSY